MRIVSIMAIYLAGAFAQPVIAARAQSLLQQEPMTHVRQIDRTPTGTIQAPVVGSPGQPPAVPPSLAKPVETPHPALRHLPNNAQGLRIAGEIGMSEWPVFFTAGQAAQPVKFQLGYLSAVSNLPEASKLSVQLNDVEIGSIQLDATHKVKTSTFDIPANLLKPGFNSLRIIAVQRHRVDCSLAATYELWTQIDSTQTGFLFPALDTGAATLDDIPALPPAPQGGMPIRVLLNGATNAHAINTATRMVELVAIRGRFEQPLVEVATSLADGPGVNIAAGLHAELIKIGGLEGLAPPAGPVLAFLPATGARRATIIASGRNIEEINTALDEFAVLPESIGSPQGLRSARAFPGYKVEGGTRLPLRDLGVISQDFAGHLFRTSVNIVMPPDFYPADYAKFSLELAGGYAPGLGQGAQIVVSINSRIAVGSALAKASGEVFKGRTIDLPLGMLRPGLNKLEIDAHVPMAEDATCDPSAKVAERKRFLLLDDTEVVLPNLARVAMSPNLSITATGAFPFAGSKLTSHLFIPSPDPDTIAAAITLVARMALSAGMPLDFRISTSTPPLDDGSTLVVAAAPTLAPAALAIAGLDAAALAKVWKPRAVQAKTDEEAKALNKYEALNQARIALQRNFPAECRMRDLLNRSRGQAANGAQPAKPGQGSAVPPRLADLPGKPAGLAEQWDQSVNGNRSWFSMAWLSRLADQAGVGVSQGWEWVSAQAVWGKGQLTFTSTEASGSVINENASLLMAQRNHGYAGEGVWTVVTAATPAELKQNVFCLVDPRVWSQVAGGTAALDSSEAKVNTMAAVDPRFITTQPLSFSNVRLIAAGWLSINRWYFVTIVLVMAGLLALVTQLFVRNIGRRS